MCAIATLLQCLKDSYYYNTVVLNIAVTSLSRKIVLFGRIIKAKLTYLQLLLYSAKYNSRVEITATVCITTFNRCAGMVNHDDTATIFLFLIRKSYFTG